jgi:hypothetical protein
MCFCIKSKSEKKLSKEQRKECIEIFLKETYPSNIGIVCSILRLLVCLISIIFQTLAFYYKSKYYFIGAA